MKIRRSLVVVSIVIICTFTCASSSNPDEWTDYLGNPQRTGYSTNSGPETPVELWKVSILGVFDTSPFIVGDKVLILWKNDMYHLSKTTIILLDLLTGDVLQEVTPLIPKEYHVFEVFPVDNRIIGISVRGIYEIDFFSEKAILLAEIPEKSSSSHSRHQEVSTEIPGKPFHYTSNSYPAVLEDRIIFPTVPAVCLSKSNFSIEWNLEDTMPYPDLRPYNVACDETIVVFLVENGVPQLLAVDPSTGSFEWMSDPLPLALWLTLGEDTIHCGGRNLWTFNKDGSELWEFIPDGEIVSNIVLGPDAVYVADSTNNLYKIDLNGNLVWKTEWQGSPCFQSHLVGAQDILYCIENLGDSAVETSGSQVTAYSTEDGSNLWSLYFGDLTWVRASPAVANGTLVIGRVGGTITALASDPDLFVKQGDTFLLRELEDQAITSYEKAAELYEKKGDLLRSQEVQTQIHELENQQESPTSSAPPELFKPPIPLSAAIVLAVALIVIPIVYYLVKHRKFKYD
jgi:outer membrane protein assembly factor BamB